MRNTFAPPKDVDFVKPEGGANELVYKIPSLSFDLSKIKEQFSQLLLEPDIRLLLKNVGQFSFVNTADGVQFGPAEGAVHEYSPVDGYIVTDESRFTVFNPRFSGTVFEDIYNKTSAVIQRPLGRMRVMKLAPGQCYIMHNDYNRRYQLAIETNRFSYMIFRTGATHLIPEDGCVHYFEGRVRHTAINAGSKDRYHLVISTWGPHW